MLWRCAEGHQWETVDGSIGGPCPECDQTEVYPVDSLPASQNVTIDESPAASPQDSEAHTLPGSSDSAGHPGLDDATIPPNRKTVPESVPTLMGDVSIPDYTILGELGRGGMGVVYRAHHTKLNRVVALKMILSGSHAGEDELQRFQSEAEAVGKLQHPNVVQIYDVGEHQGRPYLSLEFVDGPGLDRWTNATPQSPRSSAGLILTLALAMHDAHQKGIIHRDLKPANVLLSPAEKDGVELRSSFDETRSWVPKITDFGLAKQLEVDSGHTRTGAIVGTPSYMAPEQAGGKKDAVGIGSDVYALGAILYELLTGRAPFKAETQMDTILQVLDEEPVAPKRLNPQVPVDLETICLKCLEKDPSRRYRSSAALGEDLNLYLDDEPIAARPVSTIEKVIKWSRRRPAVASLVVVVAVALVSLIAVGAWTNRQLRTAFEDTEKQRVIALTEGARAREALSKEGKARAKADQEKTNADLARREAEASELKSRQRLVQLNAANGRRRFEVGDMLGSLPWYTEALRLERDPDQSEIYRIRIASILDRSPKPSHRLFSDSLISDIAYSPDGAVAMIATVGRKALRWDTRTGQRLGPDLGAVGTVLRVHYTRAAQEIVTLSQSYMFQSGTAQIRRWNARSFEPIGKPMSFDGSASSLEIDPSGHYAVVTGDQPRADVWKLETQQKVAVLEHKGTVRSAKFLPDGNVITGSQDHSIRIWNVSGEQVGDAIRLGAGVADIALDRTGHMLIVRQLGNRVAIVWDLKKRLKLFNLNHARSVNSVSISPDGETVFTSAGEFGQFWSVSNGRKRGPPLEHSSRVISSEFSNDGRHVLSINGNALRVWDVATAQSIVSPLTHIDEVTGARFSPDGRQVISASGRGSIIGIGTATIWDLASAVAVQGSQSLSDVATTFEFSPDKKFMFIAEFGGTIRMVDSGTHREIAARKEHVAEIKGIAMKADGSMFASVSADHQMCVWRVRQNTDTNQNPLFELAFPATKPEHQIKGVAFSQNGKMIAYYGPSKEVSLLDSATGQLIRTGFRHLNEIRLVVFRNNDTELLTVGLDNTVRHWEVASGTQLSRKIHGVLRGASAILSPDRSLIAIFGSGQGADMGGCNLFSVPEFRKLHNLTQTTLVHSAAFSPDGSKIALGMEAGVARVWDLKTQKPVSAWMEHRAPVVNLVFDASGRYLASVSGDRSVRVWSVSSGIPVTDHLESEFMPTRVEFDPDGEALWTRGAYLKRWSLDRCMLDPKRLTEYALLMTGLEVDGFGNLSPGQPSIQQSLWNQLTAEERKLFGARDEQIESWYEDAHRSLARDLKYRDALIAIESLIALRSDDQLQLLRAEYLARDNQLAESLQAFGSIADGFARHPIETALLSSRSGNTELYRASRQLIVDQSTKRRQIKTAAAAAAVMLEPLEEPWKTEWLSLVEQSSREWARAPMRRNLVALGHYRAGDFGKALALSGRLAFGGVGGEQLDPITRLIHELALSQGETQDNLDRQSTVRELRALARAEPFVNRPWEQRILFETLLQEFEPSAEP